MFYTRINQHVYFIEYLLSGLLVKTFLCATFHGKRFALHVVLESSRNQPKETIECEEQCEWQKQRRNN